MSQIWKIVKWEFMNRVKTKLFLITTFLLPFFMGAMMYLPTILMDLEPEDETSIGIVYDDEIGFLWSDSNNNVIFPYYCKMENLNFPLPECLMRKKLWIAYLVSN